MKIAVIDVGSNTIKMKIFDHSDGKLNLLFSDVRNAGLIRYIKNGVLGPDGCGLLIRTIAEFKKEAGEKSADLIGCFATASLRKAVNSSEIIKKVKDETGIGIDLISGKDEAFYSFSGVRRSMSDFPSDCVFLDMGGGSTEIVLCKNGKRAGSYSMEFGCLSLALDDPENDLNKPFETASEKLNGCPFFPFQAKNAVIAGGTALAVRKLYLYTSGKNGGSEMEFSELSDMFASFASDGEKTKKLLETLVPDRVKTVLPGLAAFLSVFKNCGVEKIAVSDCGIREGYVFEKMLKSRGKTV